MPNMLYSNVSSKKMLYSNVELFNNSHLTSHKKKVAKNLPKI